MIEWTGKSCGAVWRVGGWEVVYLPFEGSLCWYEQRGEGGQGT